MTRSQVRQRVNASMVPGQTRQKHVIIPTKKEAKNRVWIWEYGSNYKGATVLLCIIGIAVCIYALMVEYHKEENPEYSAMCDISEAMSCTRVLTSKWGKGFGLLGYILGDDHVLNLRNPYFGIVFYILQLILSDIKASWSAKVQLTMAIMANCGSVWLAYILYFVLEDFCIVCVSMYVVNFLVLCANIVRFRALRVKVETKKE